MTGYAAATHETPQGSLALELKSVNHRFLEFQSRMPEDLRPSSRRCARPSPRG